MALTGFTIVTLLLWALFFIAAAIGFRNFYFKDEKQLRIITMLVKPGAGGVSMWIHLIETFTPYRVIPQIEIDVDSNVFTLETLSDMDKFEGNAKTLQDHEFQVCTKTNIFGLPAYRLVKNNTAVMTVIPVHFSNGGSAKLFYLRTLIPALSMYQRKLFADIKAKNNRKIH